MSLTDIFVRQHLCTKLRAVRNEIDITKQVRAKKQETVVDFQCVF